MTTAITKIPKSPADDNDFDRFVLAMALIYASRPRTAEPDASGFYYIGQVDDARLRDQRLDRWSPYSVCRGVRD